MRTEPETEACVPAPLPDAVTPAPFVEVMHKLATWCDRQQGIVTFMLMQTADVHVRNGGRSEERGWQLSIWQHEGPGAHPVWSVCSVTPEAAMNEAESFLRAKGAW